MCGHGVIGLVTVLLDHGMHQVSEPETVVRLETPSGLVTATASVKNGRVESVRFRNVPSFATKLDQKVDVPGIGSLRYDLAFGGAYYAFCRAEELDVELLPGNAQKLKNLGMDIKQSVMTQGSINHPCENDLGHLYGTIVVGQPQNAGNDSRQVCIFADGALDRSPTGTGVSAHLALLAARNRLAHKQPFVVESILGTTFIGTIVEHTDYHGQSAIITEVEGRAYITGRHEFLVDPDDPLQAGFLLQ
jgi:trans-L-3-hydroxyproline dehydratase